LLKKGGSESKQKPVGTFFYCIDYKNETYIFKKIYQGHPETKLKNLLKDICRNTVKIINKKDIPNK
jgi:nicotinamide-nucleotide amidase